MRTLLAGLCGLVLLSACASLNPGAEALPWDSRVVHGQLANGLQYRLVRDTSQAGRLDVRLTVNAGSVDETDDQVGVAHLLEHLVFYSRNQQPGTIRAQMEALGWKQALNYNAQTNYERTQYMLSPQAGAKQSEQALQALATLVFAGNFTAADLERERPIVTEEWRGGLGVAQRMNDQRTASQRVGSRYPAHRTIGNETAIAQAQLAALRAFHQRWYKPNNMLLAVVGDFEPQALLPQIQQWLGQPSAAGLPVRERELPLDTQLKIFRLQDSQSGSNQVALLLRMHEPDSRAQNLDGLRERLIDRLTMAAFLEQLRRQPLAAGVLSLTAQKTLIGEHSSVLGIAARVDKNVHEAALKQLLEELERSRRYGISETDFVAQRERVKNTAEGMLGKADTRDFQQWVNELNDAINQDRAVASKHAIAQAYLQALATVSVADVNKRLRRWLASEDQVLQYSAPGLTALSVPSVAQVQRLAAQVRDADLAAPAIGKTATQAAQQAVVVPPAPSGNIVQRRHFAKQKVEHWQLGNGDRLVWLRAAGEGGRMLLQADSAAGFMATAQPAWRSQMAAQLASHSGPQGWSADATQAWRKEQQINFSVDQQAQRLSVSLSTLKAVEPAQQGEALQRLLRVYRLSQAGVQVDEQAFTQARDELFDRLDRERDHVRSRQDVALRELLHGQDTWQQPTGPALRALTREGLDADWQQLAGAPVTYYLMADVEPPLLAEWVERELAGIPRQAQKQSAAKPALQQPGRRQVELAIAVEPRAALQAQSYNEQPWTPVAAAQVSALRDLARSQLKQKLRGEAAGVYRLNFDAELNPESGRIESRLSFSTDPARVEELWQLAQATLAALPSAVNEAAIAGPRKTLQSQEALRLNDSQTQFRRLLLSERHWGDPRYLSEQQQLVGALQVPALRRMAGKLFGPANVVQLRLLPAPQNGEGGQP